MTLLLLIFSLSTLADTALGKIANQNQHPPNLVELFKVKKHADAYIKQLEKQLQSTHFNIQEANIQEAKKREGLFVEYARTLLYYQENHSHQENNSPEPEEPDIGVASVKDKSLEPTTLKSNNVKSKGIYSKNTIYNKALTAFKKASKLALERNRIKYTRELFELTVKLKDKSELIQIFD